MSSCQRDWIVNCDPPEKYLSVPVVALIGSPRCVTGLKSAAALALTWIRCRGESADGSTTISSKSPCDAYAEYSLHSMSVGAALDVPLHVVPHGPSMGSL